MYQEINHYLAFRGVRYIKPEKAGPLADDMLSLKQAGQAARASFTEIAKALALKISPWEMGRVSNWANQAQIARPHFWCYYKAPEDKSDDVGFAIRLYGQKNDFGISAEVSFIERQKSERTLAKQHQVLELPIDAPLYYLVQEKGKSYRLTGTEENRQQLKKQVKQGEVRKVLVKYDFPIKENQTLTELIENLNRGFKVLLPYYKLANGQS
ncbi:ribonuclease P [Streptococcus chenjunshii]|uniref:Ribonuclease P n=1 Tax=Streptococcus chenjunshii TaxID=2173853 RepID=A0A372KJ71_9STRE|nr:ribonuclease P [Streptococcus chenjunshii]AXQ79477.1 ribonuclease P [Streptococcus chenjunshii]RFU50151.1 ribonuclease P [Streptococcus chenjunshii]RFU52303.1 ribonuclease P [Streptococcus chenjunshii]